MTLTCMPSPYQTVLDGNGDPINGAKVFVYLAGTTTKTDTYTDSTGATPNANPIIADSAGRFVAFLDGTVAYKFVYALPTDSDPPVSPFYTVDNVLATAPFSQTVTYTGTLGESVSIRALLFLSDGTGGLTAGRWYRVEPLISYMSYLPQKYAFATESGTAGNDITLIEAGELTGFAGLTTGATYYMSTTGTITTTGYRPVAVAKSSSVIAIVQSPAAPFNTDEYGVAGGSIAVGTVCYLDETLARPGQWLNADADTIYRSGTSKNIGICVRGGTVDEVVLIRRLGVVTGLSLLTPGVSYYVSPTAGQLANSPPTTYPQFPRLVGVAISSTELSLSNSPPLQHFAYVGGAVGNVGAGEDDLVATPALWADSLSYIGQVVIAYFHGSFAVNANGKRLRLKFGGTTILDTTSAAFQGGWSAVMYITCTGANQQNVSATAFVQGQPVINGGTTATAIVATADIIIKATGESAAAASNDIVQDGFSYNIKGAWSGA